MEKEKISFFDNFRPLRHESVAKRKNTQVYHIFVNKFSTIQKWALAIDFKGFVGISHIFHRPYYLLKLILIYLFYSFHYFYSAREKGNLENTIGVVMKFPTHRFNKCTFMNKEFPHLIRRSPFVIRGFPKRMQ